MATPSQTCCPAGLSYVTSTGTYYNPSSSTYITLTSVLATPSGPVLPVSSAYGKCIIANGVTALGPITDPIDCPCCPTGYTYLPGSTTSAASLCYNWTLTTATGGTGVGTFSFTDCSGVAQTVTVAQGSSLMVQASTTPSIVSAPGGGSCTTRRGSLVSGTGSSTGPGCYDVTGNYTLPIPCLECICIDPDPFECPVNQTTAIHTDFTFDFTEKYCVNCNSHGYVAPKCGANFIPTLYYDPSYIFKLKNKNLI